MVRRRRFSRARRVGRRFRGRLHRVHRQGIVSKAINGVGLLIGFNQEITQAHNAWASGTPQDIPRALVYGSSGFNPSDGSFNQQQLMQSVGSKVAAIAWVKLAHYLVRRMRIKL